MAWIEVGKKMMEMRGKEKALPPQVEELEAAEQTDMPAVKPDAEEVEPPKPRRRDV